MDGYPAIVPDGVGGAIIAWINNQVNPVTEHVRLTLQRVDADGNLLWGAGGVAVGEPGYTEFATIADDAGGAIVVWSKYWSNIEIELLAQRIGPNGNILWEAGGVRIARASNKRSMATMASDGAGGTIVVWEDERNSPGYGDCEAFRSDSNCDIYAQRISAAGQMLWQINGVPISTAPRNQTTPVIAEDGDGGGFIVWQDCRGYEGMACYPELPSGEGMDLYAQRINAAGQILGPYNGIGVSVEAGIQGVSYGSTRTPGISIAGDGAGNAIVAWPDGRDYYCAYTTVETGCDVYAQLLVAEQFNLTRIYLPLVMR
jgi:hypothetical protein